MYEELTADWDLELFFQLMDERRAELLTALGSDYRAVWNSGDHINAAGLEKLRNSVSYVEWVGGSYDLHRLEG